MHVARDCLAVALSSSGFEQGVGWLESFRSHRSPCGTPHAAPICTPWNSAFEHAEWNPSVSQHCRYPARGKPSARSVGSVRSFGRFQVGIVRWFGAS